MRFSLADVWRAGHLNGTVAPSSMRATEQLAPTATATKRELTPEQQQLVADIAVETGLHNAVKRQIEKARPGFSEAAMNQHSVEHELLRDDRDSAQLGLAKACARRIVRQCGPEKAAPAIQRVRDLKAGYSIGTSRNVTPGAPRSGHVIAAAPRR